MSTRTAIADLLARIRDNAARVNAAATRRLSADTAIVNDGEAARESLRAALDGQRQSGERIGSAIDLLAQLGTSADQVDAALGELTASLDNQDARVAGFGQAVSDVTGECVAIEQIATRADILAVNAAIEAARAGASGDGFGVIAEQMRDLANRSRGHTAVIAAAATMLDSRTREAEVRTARMREAVTALASVLARMLDQTQSARAVLTEDCERSREEARRVGDALERFERILQGLGTMREDTTTACEGSARNLDLVERAVRLCRPTSATDAA